MSSRRWNATVGNLLRDRKSHQGSFWSACTALAATIGTGNITGVAAAVTAGGPGAVFWMWVSAFLGMATAYGETVLGIRYREKDQNGGWMAGPMMYLEKRLGCPRAASGERLVPLSAGLYMAEALAVIFLHAGRVPGVLMEIMADAFSFRSAAEELQGQWAIFEVFFDTIVSCTLTALVILCVAGSGTAAESGAENGASLTSLCFFTALGSPGGYAVAVYTAGYLLAAFLGCLGAMETVWEISDIFNGLMAAPNLAALVMLAGEIHSPGENSVLRPSPGRS